MLLGSLEVLREFDEETRLRMIALTWNHENEIGHPANGGSSEGLKPFGRELIREMDRRGILADVSHLNDAGFWEVCERAELPVIASHSDCRWLCNVPRNLTKPMVRAIIEKQGFIGINFYSSFLHEEGAATLDDVIRHIDELYELGGEDVVGFGSDFDGIDAWPDGLATPADFPNLLERLSAHGYTQVQLEKLAGLNLWRVLKRAERGRSL
jgi:membrane dipeptidase